MLNSTSVKTRILASVGANLIRSAIGFFSGMLVGRGLGPSSFGDYAFLIGSFTAILSLLDLGTSNAFYTFLSRRTKGAIFFGIYFFWIAIQFVITLLFVTFIIPDSLFHRIWLGHDKGIVLVALLLVFMQQQVWQTVNQIGESMRKTVKVQLLNLAIAVAYLIGIVTLIVMARISLPNIMLLMISQYVIFTLIAYWVIGGNQLAHTKENTSIKQIVKEYWIYCKPLALLSLFVFLFNFTDKWLLQKFGGSIQQGYFQIANQIAAVSLLATTSILSIFWKEIANAWENKDLVRVEKLYRKVSRGLVMFGAIISGLLIPWAEQIVTLMLGTAYSQAWPVLALMLLYPIHQSMGQIGGTMLLARGQTKIHMYLTVGTILVSIPITYILLASKSESGLSMGALGMSLKMVLIGVVSVNIQAWVIARYSGWKFDWMFQAVGIPIMITLGFFVKFLVGKIWNISNISAINLLVPVLANCILYTVFVLCTFWLLPWLIGMDKEEVGNITKLLITKIKVLTSATGAN